MRDAVPHGPCTDYTHALNIHNFRLYENVRVYHSTSCKRLQGGAYDERYIWTHLLSPLWGRSHFHPARPRGLRRGLHSFAALRLVVHSGLSGVKLFIQVLMIFDYSKGFPHGNRRSPRAASHVFFAISLELVR